MSRWFLETPNTTADGRPPEIEGLKFNEYQNAGVREYWIVDPDSKFVKSATDISEIPETFGRKTAGKPKPCTFIVFNLGTTGKRVYRFNNIEIWAVIAPSQNMSRKSVYVLLPTLYRLAENHRAYIFYS